MRRPVELKYYQRFADINHAIEWEKQLKGWGRKKKQALFTENWELIQQLSKSSAIKSLHNNPSTLRLRSVQA